MKRRNFMQAILAAGVAPAFVRSSSLMLWVPKRTEMFAGGFVEPWSMVGTQADLWWIEHWSNRIRYLHLETGVIETILGERIYLKDSPVKRGNEFKRTT